LPSADDGVRLWYRLDGPRTLGPRREDAPTSRDRFDPANPMTDAQIDRWIKATPHKVMYREESSID
jgi:hypothetical protein